MKKLYNQNQLTWYSNSSRNSVLPYLVVGGESSPGARLVMQEWGMDIRDQYLRVKVPFFFKQWGGVHVYLLHWAGRGRGRVALSKVASSEDQMPVNLVRA